MWLLDVNEAVGLTDVLAERGIHCETAQSRGWRLLRNGHLVRVASEAGFTVILTRDTQFALAAGNSIAGCGVAVVLITLPQARWPTYRELFIEAWATCPIQPEPGSVLRWPPKDSL